MPKSKQRKNHRKKLQAYKNSIKERRNRMKKEYLEMLRKLEEENMEKSVQEQAENSINVVNADDIGIGIMDGEIIDSDLDASKSYEIDTTGDIGIPDKE